MNTSEKLNEAIKALESVNQYFVDLQNRCALTPHEEKIWAKVSKILNS